MPKFRVVRGRDAWAIEEAIVDDPEVTTSEQAEDWASWNVNADELDWNETGDVRTFDDTTIMEGEAEEVTDEQLADEAAAAERYMKRQLEVTAAERDTILAALRVFQERFEDLSDEIEDIATNGGSHPSLSLEAIDQLCERINV